MSRRIRFVAIGAALGAALAACTWYGARATVAAGGDAAGVGFGVSHLLFFLSLPWSIGVMLVAVAVASVTHGDGPGFLAPFFYAMPVVAGGGWGWLASFIGRRGRRP